MRTLAIMHLAEGIGPPQHLRPWLAALAERGPLDVVAPGSGRTLQLYDGLAQAAVLPYSPLIFPRDTADVARIAAELRREVRAFRGHIRTVRPDLVVVATAVLPSAVLAARLERVPSVVYAGEIFDKGFVRSPARTAAATIVRRFTEGFANGIVCCSETVAQQFVSRNGSLVTTIYPGIGAEPLPGDGEAFRRKHGLEKAAPCLAVVGNITRGRGQDIVVRALPGLQRHLPAVRAVFAGPTLTRPLDREYERELAELVDSLGVRDVVRFPGLVDPVADVYAAADIVVNPVRLNEAFGRVALEALVAGKPVIAARVGAIPEVLRDGEDALLVDPRPEAVAEAVRRLWADRELRERLVANGRARVLARFGEDEAVERFLSVVGEVLRRAGV